MDGGTVRALLNTARVVGSLDAPAYRSAAINDGGPEVAAADLVPDPAALPDRVAAARAEIAHIRARLRPREWRAVLLVYHEGRTLREAGVCMGICRERVRQLLVDAGRVAANQPRTHQEEEWKAREKERRSAARAKKRETRTNTPETERARTNNV